MIKEPGSFNLDGDLNGYQSDLDLARSKNQELTVLVQELAKRVAAAVVLFESIKPPMDCRKDRSLLVRAQNLAHQDDEMVRKVARL